jgi:hypothetical protein
MLSLVGRQPDCLLASSSPFFLCGHGEPGVEAGSGGTRVNCKTRLL